jgi:hypothetical protein
MGKRIDRRTFVKTAAAGSLAAGALGALGAPVAVFADGNEGEGRRVRWDIILVGTGCVAPGGQASASASGGSRITIAGTGTFPDTRNRCRKNVTGGGTWTVTAGDPGCFPGSGTFTVTELLSWTTAGGTPPLPCDNIGPNATSGLATLRVHYSNGKDGTLTISCHFVGSASCVFEGITATMDYEDFWNREAPVGAPGQPGFLEGNRTNFHFVEVNDD